MSKLTELTEPQQKWVNALRSGKYEQCKGSLTIDGKYCCLGVACEISSLELDPYWRERGTLLSEAAPVKEELGLRSHEGEFDGAGIGLESAIRRSPSKSLSFLNDAGWTFNQIANFIESYPERIFKK
jgi:hypothetical protein